MKTLYFVRHAKSSWDFPNLTDKERPLNKRGNKNAPAMAKHLKRNVSCPDVFICSTSQRTRETAKYFTNEFKVNESGIVYREELYHAYSSDFEMVISRIDDQHNSAMIFAHNPGITDYVSELSGRYIDNIPTCGVAGIELEIDQWKEVKDVKGERLFYYYPKGIK